MSALLRPVLTVLTSSELWSELVVMVLEAEMVWGSVMEV